MMRRTPLAVGLLGLVAALVLFLDTVGPQPAPPASPRTAAAGAPIAGSAVCGVGDTRDGAAMHLQAVRVPVGGDVPSEVTVERLRDGARDLLDSGRIFPDAARSLDLSADPSEDAAIALAWDDVGAATWREWSLAAGDGVPAATVAGGCPGPWSATWFIPGLSTAGGDEARIRLTNVYEGAATVALRFPSPTGVEEPLILRNVTVPGRSVREIVVNDVLPERADLAAVVEVLSGRISVEGVQVARAAIGGIDGASLLAAAPAAREDWTIPWLASDGERTSWVWVYNPDERTAAVELTLHTEDGGVVPEGLAEVTLGAGEHTRIDLSGTFPEGTDVAALTARSNGVPVVVSGATVLGADDPQDTGVTVQLGVEADASWVVAGTDAARRSESLQLVNPTGAAATVDVVLFDGTEVVRAPALQGVQIEAGARVALSLDEAIGASDSWSAQVTASTGEIVVGRVGARGEGPPGGASEVDVDEGADEGADAPEEAADADGDGTDEAPVGDDDVAADESADADGDGTDEGAATDDGGAAAEADDGTGTSASGDADAVAVPDDDASRFVAVPGIPAVTWSARETTLAARLGNFLLDLRTPQGVGAPRVEELGELPLDVVEDPAEGVPDTDGGLDDGSEPAGSGDG